jgi:hypothetical protein
MNPGKRIKINNKRSSGFPEYGPLRGVSISKILQSPSISGMVKKIPMSPGLLLPLWQNIFLNVSHTFFRMRATGFFIITGKK